MTWLLFLLSAPSVCDKSIRQPENHALFGPAASSAGNYLWACAIRASFQWLRPGPEAPVPEIERQASRTVFPVRFGVHRHQRSPSLRNVLTLDSARPGSSVRVRLRFSVALATRVRVWSRAVSFTRDGEIR